MTTTADKGLASIEQGLRNHHWNLNSIFPRQSYTVSSLSTSANPSKNERNRSIPARASWLPPVSRMECILENVSCAIHQEYLSLNAHLSCARPTSTVRTPILDRKGPTVDPQVISFLTSNSCVDPPRLATSLLIKKLPTASGWESPLTVAIGKDNPRQAYHLNIAAWHWF